MIRRSPNSAAVDDDGRFWLLMPNLDMMTRVDKPSPPPPIITAGATGGF